MRISMTWIPGARAGRWVGACAVVVASVQGMLSCTQGPEERMATDAAPGAVAIPEGYVWDPNDPRPANVPIDLSRPGSFARTPCEPMVIDTRTFPVQIQDVSSPTNQLVKTMLPPHTRPKPRVTEGAVVTDQAPIQVGHRTEPKAAFPGIGEGRFSPPDVTIAVGPEHIVQTVNSSVAFYKKDGTLQFQAVMDSTGAPGFFEVVGASTFVFDPKCVYDHRTGRFVIMALEVYGTTQSFIDIAVSDDSDPNGVWYRYRTNSVIAGTGGQIFWADYPGLGSDDEAIYVVSNLFGLNNPNFGGTLYRVVPKSPVLTGSPIVFTDMVEPFSISVQVAEPTGTRSRPYFAAVASNTQMRVQTINDPLGSPSVQGVEVDVPAFAYPPTGQAPTIGGVLGILDGRLLNVVEREGTLVFAHAVHATRTIARWYEVDINGWPDSGSTPTLTQSGTINLGGALHTIFPAIAMNRHGDIGVLVGSTSATTNPGLLFAGRRAGDAPGAMGTPASAVTSTSAEPGRWGDYFDVTVDPVDDATFWYGGEYHAGGMWRTFIGSFIVTCPANVNGDGALDVLDFLGFIDAFSACEGTPAPCGTGGVEADFNGDTLVDILDFLDFIDAFAGGC